MVIRPCSIPPQRQSGAESRPTDYEDNMVRRKGIDIKYPWKSNRLYCNGFINQSINQSTNINGYVLCEFELFANFEYLEIQLRFGDLAKQMSSSLRAYSPYLMAMTN